MCGLFDCDMAEAPTLTTPQRAWCVYLAAGVALLPTAAVWMFTPVYLLPKLKKLWSDASLQPTDSQWLMDVSRWVFEEGHLLAAGVVLLLVMYEMGPAACHRHRRAVLTGVVLLLNTILLLALTVFIIAALLAIPSLPRVK